MVKFSICKPFSEKELASLDTPITIRNKELMGPGRWNETDYTSSEIKKAFLNTDWKDKDVISLFLDHKDRETTCWAGWIKNPRLINGKVFGDLEIYDEDIAKKLVQAKAKFGISPKLKGMEDGDTLKNFLFENFSIVTKPACKTAYINLIQKEGGRKTMKDIKYLEEEEKKVEPKDKEENEELAKKKKAEEEKEELAKKEKPKEEEKKQAKKEKPKEEDEEELSTEEALEYTVLSDWTDFVSKMRKKDPKISFKAIAKAYKNTKKQSEELAELSDTDLLIKIEELSNLLKDRKKVSPEEEEKKKKEEEMKQLKEQIKKLSQQVEEKPDLAEAKSFTLEQPKEQPSQGSSPQSFVAPATPGEVEMANFLIKELGEEACIQ